MRLRPTDKYYITLPLYHGNGGVVALSAVWKAGCAAVLREKYSTSNFWRDIARHRCTAMVYIGELWRYLHNQPMCEEEKNSTLRVIAGNGLRPDIWPEIRRRFGIKRIVEHYGLTEMPAGPYMNCYGRVGACGYIPPRIREESGVDKLILYDIEQGAPVRTDDGRLVEVTEVGQVGEAIFKLNRPYSGYTNPRASARRVYKDVFNLGDQWFATGDLLRRDRDGFFYFVDRIGDTFRWKGENISTNEVAEALCAAPGVAEANVYGVHYAQRDGKVGMASLVPLSGVSIDLEALYRHLKVLPDFARPLFLRVRTSENAKTTTLKLQKVQYAREGFDPALVSDALFFRDDTAGEFVSLTDELYRTIMDPRFKV